MADVPYQGGEAQVAPQVGVPDDYQHIQTSAADFGGAIGGGLERLGSGLSDLSQFHDKVATDDQINKVIERANHIRFGDPNAFQTGSDGQPILGPDGKPKPDLGYHGTYGVDALNGRKIAESKLDDYVNQARKNLTSQNQQLEFDVQTRRLRAQWTDDISRHSETQSRNWYNEVNNSGARLSIDGIARDANNPERLLHHTSDLIGFRMKEAQIKYGENLTPDMQQQVFFEAKKEALQAQITSIGVSDPARAQRILEKNQNIAGSSYAAMLAPLRARADEQNGNAQGAAKIAAATPGGDMTSYRGAIQSIESGGNYGITGPVTKNGDRAYGAYQVMGANIPSWTQEALGHPLTPEEFLADKEAQDRVFDHRFGKYLKTNSPADAASMWFSGRPLSQSGNSRDITGTTVPAYVQKFNAFLAKNQPKEQDGAEKLSTEEAHVSQMDKARQLVLDDPNLSESVKQHALGYINTVDARGNAERRVVTRMQKDDTRSILETGQPSNALTVDRVSNALGQEAAVEFATNRQISTNYYQKTHDFSALSSQEIEGRVQSLAPTPGSLGFDYAADLHQQAAQAADAILKRRFSDPAGAVDGFPEVMASKAAAGSNFVNVVNARLLAQARLGVPDAAMSPITNDEADRYASILRPVSKGQAEIQNQRETMTGLVKDINEKYGPYAQKAMAHVLYKITMQHDAANVLSEIIQKSHATQSPPQLAPDQVFRLQVARDAERARLIAQPPPPPPPAPLEAAPVTEQQVGQAASAAAAKANGKGFQDAVTLLRSDPERYMMPFITSKKFGINAVPHDLWGLIPPGMIPIPKPDKSQENK